MKRKEIQHYLDALDSVSEVKGVKFAFTVLKNKRKITNQVEEDRELINEVLNATEGFKDFEKKRIDVCEKHARKDDKGVPILIDDKFDLINIERFEDDFTLLKEEYKDTIVEREAQMKEFNGLMDEDISFDFIKLSFEDLPEELSQVQLEAIDFMLDLD